MSTVGAVEVRLLGQLEAVADDGSAIAVRGVKLRSLVAILALHRGEPVSVERLITELWGDAPPGNPTNALQAAVSQLRRAFGAAKIVTSDAGYALAITPTISTSFVSSAWSRRVADSSWPAIRRRHRPHCVPRSRSVVTRRWSSSRTPSSRSVSGRGSTSWRWPPSKARIEADLALGRHGDVAGELEALCQRYPLRERLWELLMLALYRPGGRPTRCGRSARPARPWSRSSASTRAPG